MQSLKGIIDKAAKVCGTKTNLAKRLGISPNRLWDYESGFRPMPDDKVIELAYIAGTNPIKALGEYAFERHGKKKGSATVGTVVAVCFLGVLLVVAKNMLPIMYIM